MRVQKYERGANRAGVSRLVRIAAVLRVLIGELFESLRDESPRLNSPIQMRTEPGALRAAVARLHAFDRGERRRLPFRR
jgi:transcriptional regulator with XRE-family HTH domain